MPPRPGEALSADSGARVAARLAGYRGVTAFAQFARLLSQDQLKAVFYSETKQRYTSPSITIFHNILAASDNAIGDRPHRTASMDGRPARLAMMVA